MPARGAAIDSHFDDFWLWGERLVTINMVSDTAYTMTKDDLPCTEVLVYFPRLALIIMRDAARFQWKHGIQRGHITDLRIASTMRELTPEFLSGGEREALGKELCDIALSFKGHEVTDALKNVCARQWQLLKVDGGMPKLVFTSTAVFGIIQLERMWQGPFLNSCQWTVCWSWSW